MGTCVVVAVVWVFLPQWYEYPFLDFPNWILVLIFFFFCVIICFLYCPNVLFKLKTKQF